MPSNQPGVGHTNQEAKSAAQRGHGAGQPTTQANTQRLNGNTADQAADLTNHNQDNVNGVSQDQVADGQGEPAM